MLRTYTKNFTIHGLSTVFHGYWFEKMIWSFSLILAVIAALLISKSFLIAFINKEIVSEYKEKVYTIKY